MVDSKTEQNAQSRAASPLKFQLLDFRAPNYCRHILSFDREFHWDSTVLIFKVGFPRNNVTSTEPLNDAPFVLEMRILYVF
jgi:hypothetical protein